MADKFEKNLESFMEKRRKKEEALPLDRARELELSKTQATSSDEEFRPIVERETDESRRLAADNFKRSHDGKSPTPVQQQDEFIELSTTNPRNLDARTAALTRAGNGRVTDPEGRTGNPVYVAGTTPDGRPVALNGGDVARLSASLTNIDTASAPGADWGGATFNGEKVAPGMSYNSIAFNTAYKDAVAGPVDVLAYETGHAIHNYLGRSRNPMDGADNLALSDFNLMMHARAKAPGVQPAATVRNTPSADNRSFMYYARPQEGFAEGIRMYLRDPNGFKNTYPNAARFLRGVINNDPHLSRLLMLSQNSANPVA